MATSISLIAAKNVSILGTVNATNQLTITTPGTLTVSAGNTAFGGFSTISAGTVINSGTIGNASGMGTVQVTVSGKGDALTNTGTIGGDFVTLTEKNATATLFNDLGGTVEGAFLVNINTNNVFNNGTLGGNGNGFTIMSSTSLNVSGSGNFSTAPFGSIDFQALKGSVTISGASANFFSGLTQLGFFGVSCEGPFTSPMTGISVSTDTSGSGGSVSMFVGSIVYNGAPNSNPFIISALGTGSTGTTSGQSINIFLGSAKANLTIGSGAGDYQINAAGVNSGNVYLFTSGLLTVNNPAVNLITTGKTTAADTTLNPLVLQGELGVVVNGNITTQNTDGHYSDLQIITNLSKVPFTIDGSQASATNGMFGFGTGLGLQAGNIFIVNSGGVTVGNNDLLYGEQSLASNCSNLTINQGATVSSPSFTIRLSQCQALRSTIMAAHLQHPSNNLLLSVTSGGMTIFNTAGAAYTASNMLTFSAALGFITINGPVSGIQAHDIVLNAAKGNVGLIGNGASASTLTATPDGSGNGGRNFNLRSITSGTGTGGMTLQAQSTGTTSAGNIGIALTGTKNVTIGSTGLTIDTTATGSGPGGTLSITNNGNISVDTSKLLMSNNTADSASLTLIAKGLLYLSDQAGLNAANFATLSLTSGSATTFLFGGAKITGNGFGAGSTLSAGQILISNGGSIDTTLGTLTNTSVINLTATKGAIIDNAGSAALSASPDSKENGGSLTLSAQSLTFGTSGLSLSANSGAGGDGGMVEVDLTGNKPLTIGSGGLTISITNSSTQGGTASVTNGGNLTVDASSTNLNLVQTAFASGTGANLTLSAKGLLFVTNTDQISSIGLHDVTFGSNSKTTFLLGGAMTKGNGLSYAAGLPTFTADSVSIINSGGSVDYTKGTIIAHDINLTAISGTVILGSVGSLSPVADSSGNGGSITLSGAALSFTGGLSLSAAATMAGGNGGDVSLSLTGKMPLTFGGSGATAITANISNQTTGNGGSITVANGANLNFDDSAGITIGSGWVAGKGASLSLSANGLLFINQATNFVTLGMHNLAFTSNSKTAFTLGGALSSGNGISDSGLTIDSDILSINNNSGAVLAGSVSSLAGGHITCATERPTRYWPERYSFCPLPPQVH